MTVRANVTVTFPGRCGEETYMSPARDLMGALDVVAVARWEPRIMHVAYEVGNGGNDVELRGCLLMSDRRILDVLERAWS